MRAQFLDDRRPADLVEVVSQLTFLQLDPTAAVAPAADLIAWSRLGGGHQPAQLTAALDRRLLFEHRAQPSPKEPVIVMVRPMADLGLFLADMAAWPTRVSVRQWLDANDGFRRRVLDQLNASGPLSSREIPDTAEVPWTSTGWTHERNVTQLLEFLSSKGEVAVAGRVGRERLWDVAARVYPDAVVAVPADEARRVRQERLLTSLGVARPKLVGAAGLPATIEGTDGEWRLDPLADATDFNGRTALLSPFDRLVHDRKRAVELFDFDYTLEMYKPAAKRRWGYFALPVLHVDRLVGKLDVIADRAAGVLRVNALHPDVRFTKAMSAAVDAEAASLADWLGLRLGRVA